MAVDLATLSLRIDNVRAIQAARDTGKALDEMGVKGETAARKVAASSNPVTEAIKKQALHTEQLVGTSGRAHLATGRLGNQFASLAGQIAGVHPIVGNLTSILGNFAYGSVMTVGILAGITAIAVAYDKITEGARKAKEKADELTRSLVQQAAAIYQATQAGATSVAWTAELNRDKIQGESGRGWRSFLQSGSRFGGGTGAVNPTDSAAHANRLMDAQAAVDQAWANVGKIVEEANAKIAADAKTAATRTAAAMADAEREATARDKARAERRAQVEEAAWSKELQLREARQLKPLPESRIPPIPGANPPQPGDGGIFGGVAGALSQFAPQALVTSAVSMALNAAFSGVTGMLGDLFGSGKAAAENARKMALDFKLAADAFHAAATGDTLLAALTSQRQAYEAELERIKSKFPDLAGIGLPTPPGYNQERQAALDRAAAGQAIAEERIRRQLVTQVPEDLQVRLLAAQGQDKAAAALKLQHDQERERLALVASFGDEKDAIEETTLKLLDRVQAEEKVKAAMDAVSGSMLNMVQGYKLQAVIFGAMNPRSPSSPPIFPPVNPLGPNTGPGGLRPPGGRETLEVVLSGGTIDVKGLDGMTIGKAVLKNFKGTAQRQFGDSTKWNSIQ